MNNIYKVFSCLSIFLLSGIPFNIAEAQTYSMDFKDTATYRKTCGEITPDHWKVKNETCVLSTPNLKANGDGDSVWVKYTLRVNQSGNLENIDTMHFRHKINQRAWEHDITFHGDGTNNVFGFIDSVKMKSNDTVKFDMIGFTGTQSKFWQIKNGDFSVEGAAMAGAPMPIELASFDVSSVDNYVLLEWATYSEANNDYFTVERSKNAVAFEPVLTIDGAGNSNELISYSAVDGNPLPGTSYYRLKQTDFDGVYKYFLVKVVKLDCIEACIRVDEATKSLTVLTNICGLTFSIFDIEGNIVVMTKMNSNMISIQNLASGVYILTLRNDKFSQTKKIIIN
ncbi:MAG: T9SS type A sorting domain-containing protein [Bacteroidales bacterium]|nr:T9SS type A sorting domain-containing protein [Bacteroidales bacterium]